MADAGESVVDGIRAPGFGRQLTVCDADHLSENRYIKSIEPRPKLWIAFLKSCAK